MRCATWKRRVKAEINEMINSQASSLELGQREDGDVIDGKRDHLGIPGAVGIKRRRRRRKRGRRKRRKYKE